MNKKILFDISPIVEGELNKVNRTGIYFAAVNILHELRKRKEIEIDFYCDPKIIAQTKDNYQIINDSRLIQICSRFCIFAEKQRCKYKAEGKAFIQDILAIAVIFLGKITECFNCISTNKIKRFNAFLSIKYQAPKRIMCAKQIQKIIIIHDVIEYKYPEYFKLKFQKLRKSWLRKLVETANNDELFLTNSEQTKRDFLECRPDILAENVQVVYHACALHFRPCSERSKLEDVRQKYNIPKGKRYLFSLCAIEPRKNLVRIVKTFIQFVKKNNISDMVMVLGGKAWNSFAKEFENSVGNMADFYQYVIRIGYVDDEDLPILYSGAEWFVYTSQYEGFGVPPLEAMSCGCPVIVSNSSSLPEVVGDAGLLIDWDSDEQHIRAYEDYYFDDNKRKLYADKGLKRASQFSWSKMTDTLIECIK